MSLTLHYFCYDLFFRKSAQQLLKIIVNIIFYLWPSGVDSYYWSLELCDNYSNSDMILSITATSSTKIVTFIKASSLIIFWESSVQASPSICCFSWNCAEVYRHFCKNHCFTEWSSTFTIFSMHCLISCEAISSYCHYDVVDFDYQRFCDGLNCQWPLHKVIIRSTKNLKVTDWCNNSCLLICSPA